MRIRQPDFQDFVSASPYALVLTRIGLAIMAMAITQVICVVKFTRKGYKISLGFF